MTSTGRVRVWRDDDGWGVIDSPATPGGCWTHCSVVLVAGHGSLVTGQEVEFTSESADQDGYAFRAVAAWPADADPVRDQTVVSSTSAAYSSSLRLTFDEDEDEVGPS